MAAKDSGNEKLRSKRGTESCVVRFINWTFRKVDAIWIDYEGREQKQGTMDPKFDFESCLVDFIFHPELVKKTGSGDSYLEVDTYATHPWIFRDAETQDHLVVIGDGKKVYEIPEPRCYEDNKGMRCWPVHGVKLMLPVCSLKEYAFQAVQKRLKTADDVFELQLPKPLEMELYKRSST